MICTFNLSPIPTCLVNQWANLEINCVKAYDGVCWEVESYTDLNKKGIKYNTINVNKLIVKLTNKKRKIAYFYKQ